MTKITIHKCVRCGYEWPTRKAKKPVCCAGCHARNWDRDPIVRLPKVKPQKIINPLDNLNIGQKYMFQWHWLPDKSWPDDKKNKAMNQMIGRHAAKFNRTYWKEPKTEGLWVHRIT